MVLLVAAHHMNYSALCIMCISETPSDFQIKF